MKTFGVRMLALVPVFLMAGIAVGQVAVRQLPFAGGFGGALVLNPSVQKELKMTDEQIEKAKTVTKEVREKHQDDFAKLKDAKPEERREKLQEVMKKVSDATNKAMTGILDKKQSERLGQIELQQKGLGDADVQKTLNLTDEQKEKIKTINEDVRKDTLEIFKNAAGDFKKAQEDVAKLRKESREKSSAVLTDAQKKNWKEMTGEPFELQMPALNIRPLNKPNDN